MEALACGTPVIAFRVGALPEIVENGRTGFLVSDEREMVAAIRSAHRIRSEDCRVAARARFSLDRMTSRYFDVYRQVTA
jgi:glycosyltransferase involved in cell wall biosynthesis